jgi:peroxiredoxin Q/BCP
MTDVELIEGAAAPDFELDSTEGGPVRLSDYRGKRVVLYFYPRDNTSGCTKEACGFNEELPAFEELNAVVLGVSPDSVRSHERFREKHGLRFPLLSDPEKEVIQAYGAWKEKTRYGKKSFGVERSTFLIDEQGVIRRIWRKVKVAGHVAEVAAALRELDGEGA